MIKRAQRFALLSVLLCASAAGAQQYPLMDVIADKVIQRYQSETCEQLWKKKGEPKTQKEQEALQLLHDDPQMRTAFINKVAAPIVNKMFACGLIP